MPRDCLFLSTEAQLSQFCEFLHQENEKKNKAIESRFVQLPPLILPGFENSCLSHCLINIPCRKKNLISSRYKPCTEGSFNHSSPSTVLQEKNNVSRSKRNPNFKEKTSNIPFHLFFLLLALLFVQKTYRWVHECTVLLLLICLRLYGFAVSMSGGRHRGQNPGFKKKKKRFRSKLYTM